MSAYYESARATVFHGDCRDIMEGWLPDNWVDSIVTDPPYELGFMGKGWDGSGIAYNSEVWENAYRILKPGGHLLAFGGTRTWHRLAVAIEDAGFEVRDSIAWIYGSGFPKSHDVSKAIDKAAGVEREVVSSRTVQDIRGNKYNSATETMQYDITAPATPAAQQWQGWGTALKPAFEPIVVARKPLIGTVAENVLAHGTGGLNIDATRISMGDEYDPTKVQRQQTDNAWGGIAKSLMGKEVATYKPGGRWPANVILDESQAAELDRQSGDVKGMSAQNDNGHRAGHKILQGTYGDIPAGKREGYNDTGGASRFFYCPKAGKRERPNVDGVAHPTVKPLKLMEYLCRLVTPPGGTILEPFAGSGTTIEAALNEGFNVIGIEMTDEYLPLIMARIERHGEKLC